MKGRKPKFSQDVITEIAERLAAGESPSALAREKNMKRTSVIRCKDSARLPTEAKNQNLDVATQINTSRQREKLFWKFIDTYLRQGITLAPESTPKDVATMLESAVKLKTIMAVPRGSAKIAEAQKSEETMMIFRRRFKQSEAAPIETTPVEESSPGVLGDPKGDASESVSDGEAAGDPGQTGEANGAA